MDFTGEDHQKDQGTVGRGLSTSSYCSGCCVYGLAIAARDIKATVHKWCQSRQNGKSDAGGPDKAEASQEVPARDGLSLNISRA